MLASLLETGNLSSKQYTCPDSTFQGHKSIDVHMHRFASAVATLLILGFSQAQELSCPSSKVNIDPCLSPSPGGLFVFRQRFEPDVGGDSGSWSIDGLEILTCDTQQPQNGTAYAPTYSHEEIGSFCLKSVLFSEENSFANAEKAWAQSEVGEGVEEVWERAWNTAGRFISTFHPKCYKDAQKGNGVPEFFDVLQKLHWRFPTAQLLSNSDITPSEDISYSLAELTSALTMGGDLPVVICDNATLSTILWPLLVRGSFAMGTFEPTSMLQRESNCPKDGIIYQPSTRRPLPSTTATWDRIFRPSPRPITLSHDESKLYYRTQVPDDLRQKLALFKGYDQGKEEEKVERAEKKFLRDEL
ncbi:hypothetical protein CNBG_0372 [Cryptococcus deuterogattii R265]|uniref:uncharacterized protein n=1 Tax=Cryptococcus deuterogattii (strain R265) TaxID=294750 RepID=UPI0019374F9B|nr:hypothetical protein CNBG_0372 [Cryptococcus deuterogattii R265]